MNTFDLGWTYLALALLLHVVVCEQIPENPKMVNAGGCVRLILLWGFSMWLGYMAFATWFGWWPQ